MKNNYLILLFLIVLVGIGYVLVTMAMVDKYRGKVGKVEKQIEEFQEKLNSAKVLNQELSGVSKVILNSITTKKSFETEEVNAFVKRLADLADSYKIPLHGVFPKPLSPSQAYVEEMYVIEMNCTYVQLGQFLTELEAYDNIMKVKTLDVKPVPVAKKEQVDINKATRYRITLELSTFKIIKQKGAA